MPGILDYLTDNNGAASPWGALYQGQEPRLGFSWTGGFSPWADPAQISVAAPAVNPPGIPANDPWGMLYPSPLLDPKTQMLQAKGQAPAAPDAAAYGAMGVDPSAFMQPTPPVSPFQEQQQPAPTPPATGFGAGASPFGFAGPGSMSGVNPANFAPPAPAPAPQVAAAPSTDVSSVNRPAPAPAGNDPIPVGTYKMPRVGGGFPADDGEEDTPANAKPTQGVMPGAPQSQAAPFSLAGAGAGDRLGAAGRGFLGNLNAGPIGALLAGAGSLLTGRESDPTTIATSKQTQADNANARALLAKNVDPAVVQAAILGARSGQPGLLTTLIAQNFGPDKFQHVMRQTAEGDQIPMAFDPSTGKYTSANVPGADSGTGGFVTGPDGKPIPIPPGVNRKEFIKRVTESNADAATGKTTEAQAKASSFAARMTQAEGVLGGLQNQGQSLYNKSAGELPVVGNYLQSTDYQKYKQASSAFVTAMLRQESGAAINKSEFDRYEKELFPQPGDDASVVQQKAAMRAAAIVQMKRAAGPGYHGPAPGGTVNVGGKALSWSVN